MPQISPALDLPLGVEKTGANKFIKCSLVRNVDLDNPGVNLVVTSDWYTEGNGYSSANGRSIPLDISQIMQAGGVQRLQSVFIDNSANNGSVGIEFEGSGFRVVCPPHSQGWFPIITSKQNGKMKIGSVDKYNPVGVIDPSWFLVGGLVSSIYSLPAPWSLDIFFTDLAVPPAVWDTRILSGQWVNRFTNFATTAATAISSTFGTRRSGLYFRADSANVGIIELGYHDLQLGTIQFPYALPAGASLHITGPEASIQSLYGRASSAGDTLDFIEVL